MFAPDHARTASEMRRVLRTEFIAFLERENLADDGSMLFRGEYLVSVVDAPGDQSDHTSTPS